MSTERDTATRRAAVVVAVMTMIMNMNISMITRILGPKAMRIPTIASVLAINVILHPTAARTPVKPAPE